MGTFEEELARLRSGTSKPEDEDFDTALTRLRGGSAPSAPPASATRTGASGSWGSPSVGEQVVSGAKNFAKVLNPVPLFQAAAHPVRTAQALFDTRDKFKQAATAFARAIPGGRVEPSVMDEGARGRALQEGVYNSIAAIPVVGPMADAITQSVLDDASRGDIGGAVGTAGGLIFGPRVVGRVAGAASERVAPALRSSAQKQYSKIFSKRAKDAAVVERATPEMIRRGIKVKDPKGDLADLAEAEGAIARQAKADALAAQVAAGATVGEAPVLSWLSRAKAPLTTPSGAVSPAAATATGLYDDLAAIVQRESAGGQIPIGIAERLRKSWNNTAGDAFNNPLARSTANPEVYKVAANAIRSEINQLPGLRGANQEVGFWRDVGRLAEHAPEAKSIGGVVGEGVGRIAGESAWGLLHPGLAVKGGVEALRTLRQAMMTPQWRTASAIRKARIADFIEAGRVPEAMTELNEIMQIGRAANAATGDGGL